MTNNSPNYSSLFELNPLPTVVYEIKSFQICDANTSALRLFGLTKEDFLANSLHTIVVENQFEDFLKSNQNIVAQESAIVLGIFSCIIKKGKKIRIKITAQRINVAGKDCVIAVLEKVKSKSNFKSKNLIDSSLDIFCTITTEGNFAYLSAAVKEHWDYEPQELIGTNFLDIILEEDIAKTNAIVLEIFGGLNVTSFVNRYKKKNGGLAYNLWSVHYDELSSLYYCVVRDTTEKIAQDAKIELSEQRFKALVQEGSDMISIFDLEGNYVYTSPTTTSILGITPEEFEGKNVFEFIHPDDYSTVMSCLDRIKIENHVIVAPFRFQCNDNSWRWIESVLTNMSENPAVQGIVANSRDITAQKKEELHLKLLESFVTNTKDAVVITEAEPLDGKCPKIIYVNDAFTQMTGYTAEEMIGQTPNILQGPNTDKKELEKLTLALKNWESYDITIINYKKCGEEFWVNFSVSPVADQAGNYTHWVAIERDVTEQKTKEIEKELLAQISIDFNASNDYAMAAKALCKSISALGQFDWVELWTATVDKSKIQLFGHYVAEIEDEKFYENTLDLDTFKVKEGLAGAVWHEKKQVLWDNIANNSKFVRQSAAQKINLQAAMGVPLLFDNEVIGVLKIGTKKAQHHLKKYSKVFKQLEVFIGTELNRKKLENDLSHLFKTIPDLLCLFDLNGNFLQINRYGCELLGYSEGEILGKSFAVFVHPDDKAVALDEIDFVKNGGTTFEFENRYITKKGETIWLSWNSSLALEEGILFCTAKNITEEKRLKELVRLSSNLAKIGSWEFDLVKQTIYWSDEVHLMHETNAKIFIPNLETSISFYREDFREMVKNHVDNSITKGLPFDFEAVLVTNTKQEIWVRAIGKAEMLNGKCKRIYGSFQEITQRKEAELKLQSLADNLPGLVFQYLIFPDRTHKLSYVSKDSQLVWGFSAEEVIENNQIIWDQIIASGDIEVLEKSFAISIATKSQWNARWKYVLPSGEIKTHLGYGTPTFLSNGSVLFNSVILDVTKEAHNEALLEQVTKQAKVGSWITDVVNGDHYLSDMACAILELNNNEIIPDMESTINYFREDFRDLAQSKFLDCIKLGISFDFEAVIVTRNKVEKWVRTLGSAEVINGWCTKIYGSIQDISSLKNVENRLLTLADNLPGVVYQYLIYPDGSDELRYVSSGAEQIWGFTALEVTNNASLIWNQIKLGGQFEDVQQTVATSLATKSKWTSRFKYVMPNGEVRTYLASGIPEFLTDGTILFNSIILDITIEAKNEQLLEQTTTIARIGSWELDLLNGKSDTMRLSPMVHEILELDDDYNPSYSGCLDLNVGESKDKARNAIELLISKGIEFSEELQLKTPKGNKRWVVCIGICETVNGERVKIYGSFQDITDKKIAVKKLEKAFAEKSTILESIGDAFCSFDTKWIVTYWNKEAETVLGKTKEEILGKNLWEEYPDVVGTEFFNQYYKAVNTKNAVYFEAYYETLNMWLEVSAYPSEDGLSVYFKNITERKLIEQEKNNLQETLENSLNEIYIFDAESLHFTYVNKGALINLGYTDDEIKLKTPLDLKPDFTEDQFKKLIEPLLHYQQEKIIFFTIHKRKDGSTYPVEVHLQYVEQHDSKRFLAIVLDITERNKAEAIILQANERFEKVTEATNDAIWDWDLINDTYYRSKAIERFIGKNSSPCITEKYFWKDNFHPDDLPQLKESIETAIADINCMRWEAEYRIFNDENKIVYVEDRGVIIRDNEGKAVRMVGAMSDITEEKELSEQLSNLNKSLQQHALELERSNEELEQFAFVASHDLQEPLRMISSFMDQLKRKYSDSLDEKALQYIYFATDGAKRMKRIILDLLDYSRAGKPAEEKEELDLNEIVQEYQLLRRKVIEDKDVTILSDNLPTLTVHKAALTQIFHCFLDNAIKFSKSDRKTVIEVIVVNSKYEWTFAIKDNGIGIDAKFFDKIFVIFQRLHNKDQYAGTGIGLSIAKRHIEFLGGRIWVESQLNEGTTFYFTIQKN